MTACPKPAKGTAQLERRARRRIRERLDEAENQKVKRRSGGWCEVTIDEGCGYIGHCLRRAVHVHHVLSGIGVRGRGSSALAENKLAVCQQCHVEIHAKTLIPEGPSFRRRR